MKTLFKNMSALALTLIISGNCAWAQVPTDSIVADFNEFVRLLEETHPDPYTNYGGRPYFRRAAMETRFGLAQDSVTNPEVLAERIMQFIAPLRDGHTNIWGGNYDWILNKWTEISFLAMNEGIIYVSSLPAENKELIGSKLLGIEDMSIQDILTGLSKNCPAENEMGRMLNMCWQRGNLYKVMPNLPKDSITYHLETPEGKHVALKLPCYDHGEYPSTESAEIPFTDIFPKKHLAFDFVGKDKNTMYLRLRDIMARDCFEFMRDNGWDYLDQLEREFQLLYRGQEMPSNPNEAIAMLPSMSEEFEKMLLQMKQNGSKNLIIDLRNNTGGFTPIIIPTLYQMWGDEYLMSQGDWGVCNARILSPLLMKKYNTSLEQENATNGTNFIMGDYFFEDDGFAINDVTDELRTQFINNCMSSVKDKLMSQKGKPVYKPEHVYVLTDYNTFSAAFHYTFFLWKMGATVVGVTCCQAPNTYMEVTEFELPRTGLKGSISNSLQVFLPADDPRAKDFYPDLMPTYDDFKRYNFDGNTIPLYLMDIIDGKKN